LTRHETVAAVGYGSAELNELKQVFVKMGFEFIAAETILRHIKDFLLSKTTAEHGA